MFIAFSSPTSRESSAWRRPICSIFLLMKACFDPPQDRPSRASLPAWYSRTILSRKCATSLVCIPLPLSSTLMFDQFRCTSFLNYLSNKMAHRDFHSLKAMLLCITCPVSIEIVAHVRLHKLSLENNKFSHITSIILCGILFFINQREG